MLFVLSFREYPPGHIPLQLVVINVFVLTRYSTVGDVVCNIYSSALSMQLLGSHFVAVPRYAWCTVLSLATFGLAYGGRNVLETIINNLLSMLGYWTLAFAAILFVEHFWFRPRIGGYDLTAWQDPQRLPWGLAGTASRRIGIGFSFLGMDQTWVRSVRPMLRNARQSLLTCVFSTWGRSQSP